jgi:hypothetical protein
MSTKTQALRQIYAEADQVGTLPKPFACEDEELELSWIDRNPFFQFLMEFWS